MKDLKMFFLFLIVFLIVGGGFFLYQKRSDWSYKNILADKQKPVEISAREDIVSLVFVGDIMLSRSVEAKMKKENDWRWPFLKIVEFLQKADLSFGNLEGPISDQGMDQGSKYSFRADPRAIEGLKYAGLDIVSVANNHISDWATPAFEDTLKRLKEAGISYVGGGFDANEAYQPLIKTIKGVKICFLAYTDLGPRSFEAGVEKSGIAFFDMEASVKDIEKAKNNCDFLIVSLHFGEEYQEKANNRQKVIAKALLDGGADLIIGHHPHVIQEVESSDDKYVAYSLGNFVFDQTFSEKTRTGLALWLDLKDKKISNLFPYEIAINNEFQPALTLKKTP